VLSTKQVWQRVIGSNVELQVNLCSENCLILIDPGQFDQVLMNLILNARDAMPEGGNITIDIRIDKSSGDVPSLSGPCVTIDVSDNGTGIDEATQKQIFEPFFTTKEIGKGTGLGLATVYAIIEQHGGHLSVASEVEEGTCFTIHIPLADSEASSQSAKTNNECPRYSEMEHEL